MACKFEDKVSAGTICDWAGLRRWERKGSQNRTTCDVLRRGGITAKGMEQRMLLVTIHGACSWKLSETA
jgi:hypothetical protein